MIPSIVEPRGKRNLDLISVLPTGSQASLPQTLFQNEFVSLVLVQLKKGQRLHFSRLFLRLLTVANGCVRMHGPNGSFVLHDSGYWRLEHGEHWKIRALTTDAVVSLLIVTTA